MQKYLWIKVSNDKYEFPEIIANTRRELAKACGVTPGSISKVIKRAKESRRRCVYQRIEVDD